jgi:hypothetical protein
MRFCHVLHRTPKADMQHWQHNACSNKQSNTASTSGQETVKKQSTAFMYTLWKPVAKNKNTMAMHQVIPTRASATQIAFLPIPIKFSAMIFSQGLTDGAKINTINNNVTKLVVRIII